MAQTKDWPAWRYGPSGEAAIFSAADLVPKGWVDHPSKLGPAPEKLGGEQELREELERARAEAEELRAQELEQLRAENEALREMNQLLQAEGVEQRAEIAGLRKSAMELAPSVAPSVAPEPQSARRPRRLSAVPSTPVTPQDETITLDEGRDERLKVLRSAGITIADDATDGDIEEALDWLEQQPKKD